MDDEALLRATKTAPEAFAAFYRRHETATLRYFARRAGDSELALDLCAETFAAALQSSGRFRPGPEPARAWLFGIARNTLAMSLRRGRVERRARLRLSMPRLEADDELLERVEALAMHASVEDLVADLPSDQREALLARVVDDREYADIAAQLECSEAVVRKRVSRGLRLLRQEMEAQ